MRRLAWRILLVASLCLNAGFFSAFVVHKIHRHRDHGMPDMKLSPPVQAQMDANFAAFRARLAVLHGELHAERAKLVALLAAQDPPPEAIEAQQEKVLAANDRIVRTFTQHMLNQKRLLSPAEQRIFFDHIQHRNPESDRRAPSPK
jgi:Spy/CpxP family protein refolding chaperone